MNRIEHEAAPLRGKDEAQNNGLVPSAVVWGFINLMFISEVASTAFVVFKLTGIVDWTWKVTLIPVWFLVNLIVTATTFLLVIVLIKRKK
jgi:hypothetical protein